MSGAQQRRVCSSNLECESIFKCLMRILLFQRVPEKIPGARDKSFVPVPNVRAELNFLKLSK